jgi:hypothetical protein
MTLALLRVEVVKIARRRAMLLSCAAVALLLIGAVFTVLAIIHARDPDEVSEVGGAGGMEGTGAILAAVVVVLGGLIGARAGAYDGETHVVRYWAMTGVPRLALVGVRLPAAVLVTLAALAPAFVLGLACSAVLPAGSGEGMGATDIGSALWTVVLATALWTSFGVGIGSLLNSTGAGIAVTLAVSLVGAPALSALELLWSPLAAVPLGNAQTVLTGGSGEGPVWAAILVALIWVAAPAAGAAARMRRAEL